MRLVMVSDFISCDGRIFHRLRSKKKRSLRLIACFIFGFLGCLALFSSYEGIRDEDEYSRENRLSRGKSSTMVVSIMHVDYGMLATPPDSIVIPPVVDDSVSSILGTCCGLLRNHTRGDGPLTVGGGDNPDNKSINNNNNNNAIQTTQENSLGECEPTVQVRVTFSSPFWTLQALDQNGRDKKTGGDEFFVVFSSSSSSSNTAAGQEQEKRQHSLVAKVVDQDNGSYHLDFIQPPLSRGAPSEEDDTTTLQVHMLYTCGMGRLAPPLKETWGTNGALLRVYGYYNNNDGTEIDGATGRAIRIVPPTLYRQPWNDGQVPAEAEVGERELETMEQHQEPQPQNERRLKFPRSRNSHLRKIDEFDDQLNLEADQILFFGDNNTLAIGRAAAELVGETYSPEIFTGNHSVQFAFGNLPRVHYQLDQWFGDRLRFPESSKIVALVIGTSFFDLASEQQWGEHPSDSARMGELDNYPPLGPDQVDHLMGCEAFIRMLREEYPSVDLYWRLPIPVPFHRIPPRCHAKDGTRDDVCQESLQYLSYFRIQQMYQAQKQLMKELGVPVMDLFDAYYVSPEYYNIEDGLFSPELHKRIIQPYLC